MPSLQTAADTSFHTMMVVRLNMMDTLSTVLRAGCPGDATSFLEKGLYPESTCGIFLVHPIWVGCTKLKKGFRMNADFAAALNDEGFDSKYDRSEAAAAEVDQHLTEKALSKLEGNKSTLAAGSFVLSGQTVAATDGFRNVSKIWYDKTISYEDGLKKIEDG